MAESKKCPRLICRYRYEGHEGVLCGQEDCLLTVCQWETDGGCDPARCPALAAGQEGPESPRGWPRAPKMERAAALASYFRRLFAGKAGGRR